MRLLLDLVLNYHLLKLSVVVAVVLLLLLQLAQLAGRAKHHTQSGARLTAQVGRQGYGGGGYATKPRFPPGALDQLAHINENNSPVPPDLSTNPIRDC